MPGVTSSPSRTLSLVTRPLSSGLTKIMSASTQPWKPGSLRSLQPASTAASTSAARMAVTLKQDLLKQDLLKQDLRKNASRDEVMSASVRQKSGRGGHGT